MTTTSHSLRMLMAATLLAGVAALNAPMCASADDEAEISLEQALGDLAERTGLQIVYRTEMTKGLKAKRVPDGLEPREELRLMLEGTGLTVERINEHTVTIRRAGERVIAEEEGKGSAPQAQSRASAGAMVRLAQVGDGQHSDGQAHGSPGNQEQQAGGTELEEVVVTGTHIRGRDSRSQSPLILDRSAIDRSGYATTDQLVRSIPQNFSGGQSEETFGAVTGVNTFGGAGINLRGLGNRATLVLLNSHRVAPAGGSDIVDISLIPAAAIERVEVLTDGGSSIYGSDAIGGVVNFITRDHYDGAETRARLSDLTHGDGRELQLSQALGHDWSTGHAVASFEYFSRDPLLAGDRDFTGLEIADTFLIPDRLQRSFLTSVTQQIGSAIEISSSGYYFDRNTTRRATRLSADRDEIHSDVTSYGGSVTAAIDVSQSWRAEIGGTFGKSESSFIETELASGSIFDQDEPTTRMMNADIKADGILFGLPGGNVKAAFGGQFRREKLKDGAHFEFDRDVTAAFAEVVIPLVGDSNRARGVHSLSVEVAGRYERYDDFGSSTDPRIGVRWSPMPGLAIRGNYGTSFHAPSLFQLHSDYSVILINFPDDSSPSGSAVSLWPAGDGNPALGPETSRSWTAGAEFRAVSAPGFLVQLNYFSIRFKDQIDRLPFTFNVLNDPIYSPVITRSPSADQIAEIVSNCHCEVEDVTGPGFSDGDTPLSAVQAIFNERAQNIATTSTEGVDIALEYSLPSQYGDWDFHLQSTYLLEFERRLTSTAPLVSYLNTVFNPLRLRGRLGATWSRGPAETSLFVNYANRYRDGRSDPNGEFGIGTQGPIGAFTTLDATFIYKVPSGVDWQWMQGLTGALSVTNFFDRDPPRVLNGTPFIGGDVGFDSTNASAEGRRVAITVSKVW